jgi:hypothetical protein
MPNDRGSTLAWQKTSAATCEALPPLFSAAEDRNIPTRSLELILDQVDLFLR